MKVEFANQIVREGRSAFAGRLLDFRLRRNNYEGPAFLRLTYLSSATGAASLQAWGNAPGRLSLSKRALKARLVFVNPTPYLQRQLLHGGTIAGEGFGMNRAFSAGLNAGMVPGALPQAHMKAAPSALNRDRHAVPDQRFADRAASLLNGFFEMCAGGPLKTSKQPAGFGMQTEFSNERFPKRGSAFPGRLLKFRLRRNNFGVDILLRHAVPDQRFADRAASLLNGFFEMYAGDPLKTGKQPAGLGMQTEFSNERFCKRGSAFPGRLRKFRLRRNNFGVVTLFRHTVPDQRFADRAASLLNGFFEMCAGDPLKTGKPLC